MPEDCDKLDCCGDETYGYTIDRASPEPPIVPTYTLTLLVDPSGTAETSGDYRQGTFVQITATPVEGYTFSEWTGDFASNDNPANVFMDDNKTITAVFIQTPVYLTLQANPEGSATLTGAGPHVSGAAVMIQATPIGYFQFDNWSGDYSSINNPDNIIVYTDETIVANLSKPQYSLSTSVVGSGSVLGAGSYDAGSVIPVSASPTGGGTFTGWSGDLTGDTNPENLLMDSDKSVTATFADCNCGLVDYPYLLHSPVTSSTLLKTVQPSPDNPPGATYYRRRACLRFVCVCVGNNQTINSITQYGGPTFSGLDLTVVLFNNIAIPTVPSTYIYKFEFFGWRNWAAVPSDRVFIRSDSKFTISQEVYPGISM